MFPRTSFPGQRWLKLFFSLSFLSAHVFFILSQCFSFLSSFQKAPIFFVGLTWKPFNLYNLFLRCNRHLILSWVIWNSVRFFVFFKSMYWQFSVSVRSWIFFLLVCRVGAFYRSTTVICAWWPCPDMFRFTEEPGIMSRNISSSYTPRFPIFPFHSSQPLRSLEALETCDSGSYGGNCRMSIGGTANVRKRLNRHTNVWGQAFKNKGWRLKIRAAK